VDKPADELFLGIPGREHPICLFSEEIYVFIEPVRRILMDIFRLIDECGQGRVKVGIIGRKMEIAEHKIELLLRGSRVE